MSNGKMVIESREGCKNLTIRRKISQEKQARKFTTKGGGEQPSSPEVTTSQVKMDSSLNWEPNISNLATRTDFKRLGARPWNIFFGLKTWNGFEITEKLQKSLWEAFKDNLEVYDEIVLSLKITCIIEKVQDYPD